MNVSIRAAGHKDAEIVAEMVGELLAEIMNTIGEQAFHFDYRETRERAERYLDNGTYSVFIASESSKNLDIGFAALSESHALYAEGKFGIIPEFYVRPEFRSKGVGRMLMDVVKKCGISKGWKRLEVATPPEPAYDRTLKFYEANGFRSTKGRKLKVIL